MVVNVGLQQYGDLLIMNTTYKHDGFGIIMPSLIDKKTTLKI